MAEVLQAINEIITEHWVKFVTAGAFTGIGWLIARRRAVRDWQRREFFDRINVSLNSIIDGTLRIRTLSEKPCSEVFLNKVAVDRLLKVAQKTTMDNALIPIAQDDCWFYLNAVLNELSEQFAEGLLRRDAGQDVKPVLYTICLTNESDGDVRTRKIRAMVIRKDKLLELPEEPPKFESQNHKIRWKTLHQMKSAIAKEPWRAMDVELVF